MSATFDDYVKKRALMAIAEADAAAAVSLITRAAQTLGTLAYLNWKNLPLPGMPPININRTPAPDRVLPARGTLEDWPTRAEVTAKIFAYHQAVADVDAVYEALTPAEKAAAPPPPPST
jgi:hypothetical protein